MQLISSRSTFLMPNGSNLATFSHGESDQVASKIEDLQSPEGGLHLDLLSSESPDFASKRHRRSRGNGKLKILGDKSDDTSNSIEENNDIVDLIVEKKWSGYIASVFEDEICCIIREEGRSSVEEEITLSRDMVYAQEKAFVKEGALFSLFGGREIKRKGQVQKTLFIRFRRMPNWTSDEVIDAQEEAQEFVKGLIIE